MEMFADFLMEISMERRANIKNFAPCKIGTLSAHKSGTELIFDFSFCTARTETAASRQNPSNRNRPQHSTRAPTGRFPPRAIPQPPPRSARRWLSGLRQK